MGPTIGRDPGAGLALDDPLVSARHATLAVAADGAATSADLGSTNGTRVNGRWLTAHRPEPRRDGARIQLGDATLRFAQADA